MKENQSRCEKRVRNRKTTFLHQCARNGSSHLIRPQSPVPSMPGRCGVNQGCFLDVPLDDRTRVKDVSGHHRRSRMTVSEIGSPSIFTGSKFQAGVAGSRGGGTLARKPDSTNCCSSSCSVSGFLAGAFGRRRSKRTAWVIASSTKAYRPLWTAAWIDSPNPRVNGSSSRDTPLT